MLPPRPTRVEREAAPPAKGFTPPTAARELLREDFGKRCAYCMIHERYANGPEAFEIDHFQPRSAGGDNRYGNLYWTCRPCNQRKWKRWPTAAEQARGIRFADPCAEWDYGNYFWEEDGGRLAWDGRLVGEYHVRAIGLNRPTLLELRGWRQEESAQVRRIWRTVLRADPLLARALRPLVRASLLRAGSEAQGCIPVCPRYSEF